MRQSTDHHYQAYGEYSEALNDYKASNIIGAADLPEYAALMKIEEPYHYRARYTMPKYVVNAAGDQYFLPDSSQFYFDDLPGEKYLRYVPNTDHSLKNSDAVCRTSAGTGLTATERSLLPARLHFSGSPLLPPPSTTGLSSHIRISCRTLRSVIRIRKQAISLSCGIESK